jgi:hypothetical protein
MSTGSKRTESNAPGEEICPACGAANDLGARSCWLCFAPLGMDRPPATASELNRQDSLVGSSSGFSLASLMMLFTLTAVVLGVSSQWPGLGIPLGLISFFVWLRTVSVVRYRVAAGEAVSSVQKLQLFMSSLIGTVGVIILVAISGIAALATACAVIIAAIDPREPVVVLVAVAAGVVTVLCIFLLRRILRSRKHLYH